jgi:1-acyl-sn-glycerol-3-phosphate acyltransferase
LYFLPHPLEMHFLPEVAPKPGETMEELKNRVFEIMKDYYVKNS